MRQRIIEIPRARDGKREAERDIQHKMGKEQRERKRDYASVFTARG